MEEETIVPEVVIGEGVIGQVSEVATEETPTAE